MRKLPLHPGARGLKDDCAVIEIGSETLILTHDSMAEGTHWLPGTDPFDIAWKLVATNLSDLAAKGAKPLGVLLSHTLGEGDARFLEGLAAILAKYDVPMLGGDTISADGPRTLGLTAIGSATHTPPPSRSGAKIGDAIYVCGVIGDAFLGYQLVKYEKRKFGPDPHFLDAFLRPAPLLREGELLAPHVTAMMDVSDGLYLDAARMAQASGVCFSINQDDVPHSEQFYEVASQGNLLDVKSKGRPTRRTACAWGDDYALLFTAPAQTPLPSNCKKIGSVLAAGEHSLLVDGKPLALDRLGYEHR